MIGAGSAGCALVERLTVDGRTRVLLLEAGGSDRRFWIRTPIGYGKLFDDERVNWKFLTEPDPGLGGRRQYWPRGKVVGGSSSINAMVYARGLPGDYDDWAAAGNPGWSWQTVEPIYQALERRIGGDGSIDGDGPLWVSSREPEYHPIKRHVFAAARELRLRVLDDLNVPDPDGIAPFAINTRSGYRWSSADAFLRPALERANFALATEALAERIVFTGRRASGVVFRRGGAVEHATARREVILCAGAIQSPKLLQVSGIGPASKLKGLGIAVIHNNGSVGGNLQDHLGISYFYEATEPTLNKVLGSVVGRLKAGIEYLLTRSGPLSLSVNQIGGLVRSDASLPRPDIQLYFNPLSYSASVGDKRRLLRPDPWQGFVIGFNACRPTSRGRIDIVAADPVSAPSISANSLSTAKDIADAVAGARLIARFEQTTAMRTLIHRSRFDLSRASDDEIVADFRARASTVFHPCGTCRMAAERDGGVVDPALRVYGVEGLRVADASIFPNITSANTNAPSIMVGRKAGELVLGG